MLGHVLPALFWLLYVARVEAGRPASLCSGLDGSDGGGEKWSHSGCVLKLEPASGLDMGYESK